MDGVTFGRDFTNQAYQHVNQCECRQIHDSLLISWVETVRTDLHGWDWKRNAKIIACSLTNRA